MKTPKVGRPTAINVDAVRTACIALMKHGKRLSVKNIRHQTGINGSDKKFSEIRNLAMKDIAKQAGKTRE